MSKGIQANFAVNRVNFSLRVDFELEPGEVLAIMGPSGAGKSTLVHALAGLVQIDQGQISFATRVVEDPAAKISVPPMRRNMVLLGQEPRLFPHLSVRENIAFPLRVRGVSHQQALSEAREWLSRVGLAGFDLRKPGTLSGGQQQRVALARALAATPDVIALDEPLTSLDPPTAEEIRQLLAEQLPRTGAAVLMVTHSVLDAVLADRLMIIERGKIIQSAPLWEVLAHPGSAFTAGIAGVNRIAGVARHGAWHTDTPFSLSLHSAKAVDVADGTRLFAVFSPQAVTIVAEDEQNKTGKVTNFWATRIVRREPLPGMVRLHTDMGGIFCDVLLNDALATGLLVGEKVFLHIDPGELSLDILGDTPE